MMVATAHVAAAAQVLDAQGASCCPPVPGRPHVPEYAAMVRWRDAAHRLMWLVVLGACLSQTRSPASPSQSVGIQFGDER